MIIAYQINHPFKQIEINESNQHLLNTCLWVAALIKHLFVGGFNKS